MALTPETPPLPPPTTLNSWIQLWRGFESPLPQEDLRRLTADVLALLGAVAMIGITALAVLGPVIRPTGLLVSYGLVGLIFLLRLVVWRWFSRRAVITAILLLLAACIAWLSISGTVQTVHTAALLLPVIMSAFLFGPRIALVMVVLVAAALAGLAALEVRHRPDGAPVFNPYNQVWVMSILAALAALLTLTLRAYVTRAHQLAIEERTLRIREGAQRELGGRLALAIQAGHFGLWEYDVAADLFTINDTQARLYGLADDAPKRRADFEACLHPDDRPRVGSAMDKVLASSQERYETRFRIVWPDGQVRWLHSSGQIERDESGRARRILGLDRDVTDDVETHLRLREALHRHDLATRAVRGMVWEYDGRSGRMMRGTPAHTFIGLAGDRQYTTFEDMAQLLAPESLPAYHDFVARLRQGSDTHVEQVLVFRHPEQGERHVRALAYVERDSQGRAVRAIGMNIDITEEARRQQHLRMLSDRLRLATEAAGLGVWELDLASGHVEMDAASRELLGLPAGQLSYDAFLRCVHPDDHATIAAAVARTVDEGVPYSCSFRVAANGMQHWLRGVGQIQRDADGRPQRLLGVNWDITDDVEAQARLERVNERLQVALNAVQATVWEYDAETRRLMWDERAADIYGRDIPTDRQAWEACLTPDIAEQVRHQIYAYLRDPDCESFEIDYTIDHPQRGLRYIRCVARNERDARGRLVRTVGLDLDVTSQRLTAIQAAELASRLQLAISASGLGICIINPQDGTMEWNAEQYAICGVDRQTFQPGIAAWEALIHPEDLERVRQAAAQTWDGQTSEVMEYRIIRPDQEIRHVRTMQRNLRDQQGRLQRTVRATFDITAERMATETIERARRAAEEANQLKSEFLANVSHEIRTPMNAIIGMTELALAGNLPTREHNQVAKANAAARNLLAVINDILDFSKIEAGKLEVERTEFVLRDMVAQVLDVVGLQAAEKHLQLRIEMAQDLPARFLGDPTRLSQVLTNLLSNAIKFTDQGHVLLRVGRVSPPGATVHRLRFEVQDTGIGLSEQQQERLFEAFSQADASTTRRFGGTGLGLVISRRLLELMGGRIGVVSRLGEGANFWFEVPLEEPAPTLAGLAAPAAPSGDPEPGRRLHGLRVLLAEDNPLNRELAIELLERAGITVDAVTTGLQAVTAVQAAPYDVVLMDVQMPGMDGIEATRRIRALGGRYASLPIVAMTAHAMAGDRERSLAAGMNDHLAKPIDTAVLWHTLARLTGRARPTARPAPAVPTPAPPAPPQAATPDPRILDIAAGISLCGGLEPIHRKALQRFVELYAQPPFRLADAATQQRDAHSLKGVAASLAMPALRRLCQEAEQRCRQGRALDAQDIERLNAAVRVVWEAARDHLARAG